VACWRTKAAIGLSLKLVKIEEKLLWMAYRNLPTLCRMVPSLTPNALYILYIMAGNIISVSRLALRIHALMNTFCSTTYLRTYTEQSLSADCRFRTEISAVRRATCLHCATSEQHFRRSILRGCRSACMERAAFQST